MDDKRFDDLSRRLAVPLTRASFFKTLSALGGSALAAITSLDLAEAKKGTGGKKGNGGGNKGGGKKKGHGKKGGKKGKKGNGGQQREQPAGDSRLSANAKEKTCAEDSGKSSICHCPPGNLNNCKINCVGNPAAECGPGHGSHQHDCICGTAVDCPAPNPDIPACEPGRCPAAPAENDSCGGPQTCEGTCDETNVCPSLANCQCVQGECTTVTPTCDPACGICTTCNEATDQCDYVGDNNPGPGCLTGDCCNDAPGGVIECCTGAEVCTAGIGCCIPDGQPAGGAAECCSNTYCEADGICGECPPAECLGFCDNQETCTAIGANCVCRTLDEVCGACIPDGQPAGSVEECCSGDFCPKNGLCGLCPPAPGPRPSPAAICPPDYTGNAKSPCNGTCPCSKGRKCQKGRCCEKKGTHCRNGKECCSGKCRRIHDNHKQCA
jgi:hypothetical protein